MKTLNSGFSPIPPADLVPETRSIGARRDTRTPEGTVNMTQSHSWLRLVLTLSVGMAALLFSSGQAQAAFGPLDADFRISNVGTDADAARDATNVAVAYNPTANEYLVTWQ